jgi:hypothetical protein
LSPGNSFGKPLVDVITRRVRKGSSTKSNLYSKILIK